MNDISVLSVNSAAVKAIEEKFKEVGVTLNDGFRVIADGMKAESVKYDKYGDEVGRSPDWKERRESASIYLQLVGILKNKDEGEKVSVRIEMRPEDIERLERVTSELKEMQRKLAEESWQRGEVIDAEVVSE